MGSECPPRKDEAFFERIYQEFFRKIYNYTYTCLGNHHSAEDATSAVFERIFHNLAAYDPHKGTLSTWVFCIAHRIVIDMYRHQSKRPTLPLYGLDDTLACDTPSPDMVAIHREVQTQIGEALKSLSERDREVIALKFWGGLTNRRIAQITGLSESNTGVILYRSLQRLQSNLRQQGAVM